MVRRYSGCNSLCLTGCRHEVLGGQTVFQLRESARTCQGQPIYSHSFASANIKYSQAKYLPGTVIGIVYRLFLNFRSCLEGSHQVIAHINPESV